MGKGMLVVLLVAVSARAEAADVLCKKPNGVVVVRAACKKNQTQLNPAELGLQTQGPAAYDALGKKVGDVISVRTNLDFAQDIINTGVQECTVAFKLAASLFALRIRKDQLAGYTPLLFESEDCSGTPYIATQYLSAHLFPPVAIGPPGSTAYVPDTQSSPQAIMAKSAFGVHPDHPDLCINIQDASLEAIPALPITDLNTVFTPPFSVK